MNLHEFLAAADAAGYLITVDREVDPYLEAARLAAEVDGRPILFRASRAARFRWSPASAPIGAISGWRWACRPIR